MSRLHVDLALIKKYAVAGPRYTSYPPATKFTDQMAWPDIEAAIGEDNQPGCELSLYFHIPFCETLCWFCGCNTIITLNHSQGGAYVGQLRHEVELMAPRLHPGRQVTQVHLGGGTPTFLHPDELRALGQVIHSRFQLAPDVEAGVETDPRRLTRDHLVALREIGFNRASMGVQDFDPVVQQAVHRVQPFDLTRQAVEWIRETGFTSLNLDLIYGLPHQTPASFEQTIDQVLKLQPDRFAVFNYAHVPWMKPAQKILEQKTVLPTSEVKLQLLKLAIEKLTDEGYVYIGMDHFARPTDELAIAQSNRTLQRNFQGYSTRGGAAIYAFGVSAISQTERVYWQNVKELPAYTAALEAGQAPLHRGCFVTKDDRIRRETIMQIMCNLGLDFEVMSARLGIRFTDYFAAELASLADMEQDGLVRRTVAGLEITELGRLLVRNIAMRFDAYLAGEGERRFSKTV